MSSYFKMCALLFIVASMLKYVCRKREGEKLSRYSQGQLAQKARDLQRHKYQICSEGQEQFRK